MKHVNASRMQERGDGPRGTSGNAGVDGFNTPRYYLIKCYGPIMERLYSLDARMCVYEHIDAYKARQSPSTVQLFPLFDFSCRFQVTLY